MDAGLFTAIGSVVTALVAIGALGITSEGLEVTREGLDLWRRQLHGTDKYQVAKNIIRALNEAREFVSIYEFYARYNLHKDKSFDDAYSRARESLKTACVDATMLWGAKWEAEKLGYLRIRLIGMSLYSPDSPSTTTEDRITLIQEARQNAEMLIEELRKEAHATTS